MSKIYDALRHLEAQTKAMESGRTPDLGINPLDLQERPTPALAREPRSGGTAQSLLEHASAVMRFQSELQRRMGEAGVAAGLQGLFTLAEQLQRALATVSHHELDDAESDLERVADRIRAMQHDLRQLKAVKTDVEGSS